MKQPEIIKRDGYYWLDQAINGYGVHAGFTAESVETIFLPLLHGLSRLQKEAGRRILILLAAPPAAGKSTLVNFLQALSEITPDVTPIESIGMDGFHHTQEYLLSHTVVRDGKEIPLVKIKGSPVTFDLEKLKQRLWRVKTEASCPWPVYNRRLHDPEDGKLFVTGNIVLVEGNYLLLNEPGWRDIKNLSDYSIRILADCDQVRESLILRKKAGGITRAEAEAFVDNSDLKNVRLCMNMMEGDLTLKLDGFGDFRVTGGRLP